ncbi:MULTISPECIES: hypothetical protein [Fusobacterium]|uniref:hypothetical protein n=1 Tax=Fusobacterium TaxID=848 RepID=UPI001476F534|nr:MULTISPECIES: hypothetical protein [Fusobacterium]NME35223.1 hypothetical protein [Fusobacterium sp. FSA-380-WT-3A]
MKKLIFSLMLALSLNIFATEVDKSITIEAFKKDIVERILKGDKKVKEELQK